MAGQPPAKEGCNPQNCSRPQPVNARQFSVSRPLLKLFLRSDDLAYTRKFVRSCTCPPAPSALLQKLLSLQTFMPRSPRQPSMRTIWAIRTLTLEIRNPFRRNLFVIVGRWLHLCWHAKNTFSLFPDLKRPSAKRFEK